MWDIRYGELTMRVAHSVAVKVLMKNRRSHFNSLIKLIS